jgi:hypothetical protein
MDHRGVRDSIRRAAAKVDVVRVGDQVLPRGIALKLLQAQLRAATASFERVQAIREAAHARMQRVRHAL